MFPIPVADTISEISERITSLPGFDSGFVNYITENIKHHLSSIQCSGKLDLSDPTTREWVEQVTDLFYLVDNFCADVALLQKPSNVMMIACKCNLTLLSQLKQIEKKVIHVMKASKKNVKMLPELNFAEEGDHYYYYKEIIKESCLAKEEGVVKAVTTFTFMKKDNTSLTAKLGKDEEVKRDFDVVTCIDDGTLKEEIHADHVVDRVKHDLEEEKKKNKSNEGKGKGKGFLVVLDYFNNDLNGEEWLKFAEKLKKEAATSSGGGVLLVITMKLSVAQLVASSFEPTTLFRFDWLSPSETPTRSLFEQIAKTIESLLKVPREVIPAATKIMTALVSSRKLSSEAYINSLKDEFLYEMWLEHYHQLGLSDWCLKQCFAYSLFIFSLYSHYYVKPEMLVRLWMAQGFLRHLPSKELEDSGHDCIKQLCDKKISIKYSDGDLGLYSKMRDLANVVIGKSGDESWDKHKGVIDREGVLISSGLDVLKGTTKFWSKVKESVGSFLLEENENLARRAPNQVRLSWFACDVILSTFKKLRMLTLKRLGIKVLPDSIGDLKNLRYLDLSYNNLKYLCNNVGELRYLQTLLLSHCLKLTDLPNDVNHFVSLRHLEVDHCPNLKHMPSALKKLTWVRSLPHFVASSHNGVGELTNLNEIRGGLEISHLERFKFKPAKTYLEKKQNLERLSLRWNHDGDQDNHSMEDHNQNKIVLDHLQPHQNLKKLSIIGYRGNQFSNWLSHLTNLVEINLYYCPKCQSLPTLDLQNLKRLTLVSLDSLEFITDKDSVSLKLKRVKIEDCQNLSSWWKSGVHNKVFSDDIKELVVEYCPKLVSMPLFPNLDEKLVLDCSNMEPLLNTLRYKSTNARPLSKLRHLTMVNLEEKQYPREEELLKNFTGLESLYIRNCKALKSIKGWKDLSSLDSLHISNCTDIDLPSEEWKGMQKVTDLVIKDIPDLESLLGIKELPNLTNLEIKNCPELTTLPKDMGTDIFIIFIEDCPKLASLPESFENKIMLQIRHCPLLKDWIPKNNEQIKFPNQTRSEGPGTRESTTALT